MSLNYIKVIFIVVFLFLYKSGFSQVMPWSEKMASTAMTKWPAGSPANWNYEQGLVIRSIETLWNKSKSTAHYNYIKGKVDYFVNTVGAISTYNVADYNLDMVASGRSLLFLYKQTGLNKYKVAAGTVRSQLTNQPRTVSGGFWHKKVYPDQMWLDGLFMADPFYAEYSLLFDQSADYNDVAKQLILMETKARDQNSGLLYHGWDESKVQAWANPVTGCSPAFWGRAIGWYAMALVDVLDYLPKTHLKRDSVVQILQRLSTAIVKYQDVNSGVWYQVVDKGTVAGNYKESSASCMFVYALAKASRMGYIDPSFYAKAKLGYTGIINTFVTTDVQNKVHLNGICSVAGLGGTPYRSGTYEYYISSAPVQDDPKGIGAFILASVEIEVNDAMITGLVSGNENTDNESFQFYPNPVSEKLYVSGIQGNEFSYKIYDAPGKLCSTGLGNEINMADLKSGYYFVEIESEGRSYKKAIVKK